MRARCDADRDLRPHPALRQPRTRPADRHRGDGRDCAHLREGQLVVLESTTFPGTTREVLQPILERAAGCGTGLSSGDVSRADRSRPHRPHVLAHAEGGRRGHPGMREQAVELYSVCVETLVPVSSCEAAELTKLLENIFRTVNIALVNELAILCDRMSLNVWEIIDAASTKPYGFMRFTPGPGSEALPSHRSLLPHVEGPRVRLPDGVHRAGRQGQPADELLLRRPDRPSANDRASRSRGRPC